MYKASCVRASSDPIIPLRENRAEFIIDNPSRVEVQIVSVDGCEVVKGPRCDYLVIPNPSTEIYVELKGCDVGHAFEQIAETYKVKRNPSAQRRLAYVITAHNPLASYQVTKAQNEFKRKYGIVLYVRTKKHTYTVDASCS